MDGGIFVGFCIGLFSVLFLPKFHLREKKSMSRGGAERGERKRIPRRLCSVSVEPYIGLDSRTMRLCPELKSDTQLSGPSTHSSVIYKFNITIMSMRD